MEAQLQSKYMEVEKRGTWTCDGVVAEQMPKVREEWDKIIQLFQGTTGQSASPPSRER